MPTHSPESWFKFSLETLREKAMQQSTSVWLKNGKDKVEQLTNALNAAL